MFKLLSAVWSLLFFAWLVGGWSASLICFISGGGVLTAAALLLAWNVSFVGYVLWWVVSRK